MIKVDVHAIPSLVNQCRSKQIRNGIQTESSNWWKTHTQQGDIV